jgi:hypothetical protein
MLAFHAIACLLIAGCAASGDASGGNRDPDRPNGFYTGLTGGLIDQMGH